MMITCNFANGDNFEYWGNGGTEEGRNKENFRKTVAKVMKRILLKPRIGLKMGTGTRRPACSYLAAGKNEPVSSF